MKYELSVCSSRYSQKIIGYKYIDVEDDLVITNKNFHKLIDDILGKGIAPIIADTFNDNKIKDNEYYLIKIKKRLAESNSFNLQIKTDIIDYSNLQIKESSTVFGKDIKERHIEGPISGTGFVCELDNPNNRFWIIEDKLKMINELLYDGKDYPYAIKRFRFNYYVRIISSV